MLPLAKNIRRYISSEIIAITLMVLAICVSTGVAIVSSLQREIVIECEGSRTTVKTMKSTVEEVLKQSGIKVSKYDYVSLPLDMKLKREDTTIYIKYAVPVTVAVDGKEMKLMTCKETVKEALDGGSITLDSSDRLEGALLSDKIVKDMNLKVVRVKEEMVSESESIPFEVVKKENSHIDRGRQNVINEGKNGVREKLYKVVYEDGKEIKREFIEEKVVSEPVKRIVEYGTAVVYTTSRGESFRYKKVLDMKATAYTASFKDTGKHPGHPQFGITYTGVRAKKGIIAVDPKVIPLGTKVYIEGVGSTPDYGYAVAADIGGAIKGNKIDLYMDGQETVDRWGVKKVRVYILYN